LDFLKKLRKVQEDDDDGAIMEYQENMDSAYRKGARDEEEEASMKAIQQVHEAAVNPAPASAQERMDKLDRMKADGLLTDAEYEQLKHDVKK
jgi:hypothetical protein